MKNKEELKVLHIASYFARQKVYANLVREISKNNIRQCVFVPVRTQQEIGRNQDYQLINVSYLYAYILRPWDRVLYFNKINKIKRAVERWSDFHSVNIIHAHCLFSDGGVAFLLKKKYGIRYIVTVRNTDFRFFRVMPHLRGFAMKILKEAEQVIHVNPSYEIRLGDLARKRGVDFNLSAKSRCIPNGVADFWHKNRGVAKSAHKGSLNLLFVGAFVPLKNVPLIIEAALILWKQQYDVTVTLVGGGGRIGRGSSDRKTIDAITKGKQSGLEIHEVDKVNDLEKLKKYYLKADIYVMPSKPETFGLVYIEALSQGTPVIYSKGHGIDGYFAEGDVGYAIETHTAAEVANKIQLILNDYERLSQRGIEAISQFNWRDISKQYTDLYN